MPIKIVTATMLILILATGLSNLAVSLSHFGRPFECGNEVAKPLTEATPTVALPTPPRGGIFQTIDNTAEIEVRKRVTKEWESENNESEFSELKPLLGWSPAGTIHKDSIIRVTKVLADHGIEVLFVGPKPCRVGVRTAHRIEAINLLRIDAKKSGYVFETYYLYRDVLPLYRSLSLRPANE